MSAGMEPPQRQVPTLTEVVDATAWVPAAPESGLAATPSPVDQAELARRVLVEVQCRLAEGLESHLRTALQPALAEFESHLLRETQARVIDTLRVMVREAVAQEMALRQER